MNLFVTRDIRVGEIIREMEMKARDASKDASRKRSLREKWRKSVEVRDDVPKWKVQKMIKKLQYEAENVRESLKVKNNKSTDVKKSKWGEYDGSKLKQMLEDPCLSGY